MGSRPKVSSGDRYFPQDDPETRQHYANVRIREIQGDRVTFATVLRAFRALGIQYDHGFRLRDVQQAAA